jgi:sulfur relay (sulfurtransferase) DsrC/TusE family protein
MSDPTTNSVTKEKPSFEEYVKKYVAVDDEIEMLQGRLKTMKDWKRKLAAVITKHMEDKDLTDTTLEISDGTLRFHEKKEYSSMSFGYIEKCLMDMIPEGDQVKYVIQYLKDNRDIKYVPELKRRKYSSDDSSDSEGGDA